MTTLMKTGLDEPVGSPRDLVDYLARGARPRERWGVGVELENLAVDAATGAAAPYARIEALLQKLEESGRWRGVREEGRLIALIGDSSSFTLEPGGQLELSGQLCPDLHCCQVDFMGHLAELSGAGRELGLALLGVGVQPFTSLEAISWVPKARYGVMGPYMLRTGDMGQRMMKQSASVQVNLDYADEADCIAKLRLVLALAPLFYALFANSPFLDGKPSGFLSTRGEIWSRTDRDRTGLLPHMFREGAGFADYVEWALDVPMYFIVRGGRLLNLTGERFTFRRFLAEGFSGERATLADWDLHLSTLFPEARLRPQIEVRSADSVPPPVALAVAALSKGLLYDDTAREEAWALFGGLGDAEREGLLRDAWRLGLQAPLGQGTLREAALEALAIARRGLARQRRLNAAGEDESLFLEPATEIAESGMTLAERLLGNWRGSHSEKLAVLVEHGSCTER